MFPNLSELPKSSKIWIFPFSVEATKDQIDTITKSVENFLLLWNAHGADVKGTYDFFENRFLIIAADESGAIPSGCSIDSLVSNVKETLEKNNISLADFSDIFFRKDSCIHSCSRVKFSSLVEKGEIEPSTRVFDFSIQNLESYLEGSFELDYEASWHKRAFSAS